MNIEHGRCYQFDVPDEALNKEETDSVIDALLWDLGRTPVGKTFVVDIVIGPDCPPGMEWGDFLKSCSKVQRAEFEKTNAKVTKPEVIQFLRDNFADMLTLPAPGLRRVK